jgi:hypothetical protein
VLPRILYALGIGTHSVAHVSLYGRLLTRPNGDPGHAGNQPLFFVVNSPELIVQEIITGEIPSCEIMSELPVIMAIARNKRRLTVPEQLVEPTWPRSVIMHGIMHSCWMYAPSSRKGG